jgi:hypothetical protein
LEAKLKMKRNTLTIAVATLTILCAAVVTQAGPSVKKTKLTFSHTVEVPGATLPAGSTYVFKLLRSFGTRSIVQVTNEAENKVFATFQTLPDYRHQATSHTVVEFGESASSPVPIKAWFYPGQRSGYRFVYPKQEAERIASTYQQPVPEGPELAIQTEAVSASTIADLSITPIKVITPERKEMDYAAAEFTQADASDRAGVDATTTE